MRTESLIPVLQFRLTLFIPHGTILDRQFR